MTRQLKLLPTLALAGGLLLPAGTARATTFQMVSDANLVRQATLIAEVTVEAAGPSEASGYPATEYRLQVESVLKGEAAAGSELQLKVLGGIGSGGSGLKIWGAPELRAGERLLLFLERHPDGAWRLLHLMLGAFRLFDDGERRIALRDLGGASEVRFDEQGKLLVVEDPLDLPRDAGPFSAWIADAAAGRLRSPDYFLPRVDPATGLATKFEFLTPDDGIRIRWFRFDSGQAVPWRAVAGGQPGLAGGGFTELQVAMNAWNNDGNTNIRYTYSGTTNDNSTNCGPSGAAPEGKVIWNDPFSETSGTYSCEDGGVLAQAGPCFSSGTTNYNGEPYHVAEDAIMWTNNGLECFFLAGVGDRRRAAEELFTHEFGHTLGLGHSGIRNAVMFRSIHDDERGAALHPDDRAGIAVLYGGPGGGGVTVNAPSNLVASVLSGTSILLNWVDNSNNETSFRIEARMGSGSFAEVGNVGAGITNFQVTGLTPSTAYTFRVRARAGSSNSSYSNQVTASTLTPGPAPPTDLTVAARTSSSITLFWVDASTDETGFQIERRDFGGFNLVGTVGANVSDFTDVGLEATTRYEYRVRATNAAGSSAFTAIVETNTNGEPGPCVASGGQLCLLGGEVRVEVTFRNQGTLTDATAVALTDESGTFWFFNAANTELVVKALDASVLNGHYWFFFGALSDVEYWVQVTRTDTGEAKVYYNPQGEICGLADVEALVSSSTALAPSATARGQLIALDAAGTTSGLASRGGCVADSQTLCLLGGRFAVRVDFSTPSSGAGMGTAVPSTDLTGFFWFFSSTNIELVVKAIDGTALNGKYWFFYGALSDVQYTITVTDTATDAVRTYVNPAGNFCGVGDTSAF